jgi:carbon-monoxide dehydrogenase medium subunit
MLPHVGHFQIRNRGTVGGSLAHLDPAAEWPAIALVLGATLTLASRRGTRSVAMADFMQGPLMTALEPDELLLELTLPLRLEGHGFVEVARRPGDFALVGAVAVRRSGGAASVAVFATGTQPHRLPNLEAQLAERAPVPSEVAKAAASEIQVAGDIHATAGYRRSVGAALVAQAVEQAWKAAPSN